MRAYFLLFVFLTLFVHTFAFSDEIPTKIIEVTINPKLPPDPANNQFANLPALLTTYTDLNFSELTRMVIKFPADTLIEIDQIGFNNTQNLEIVIQGANRETSVLSFTSSGSLDTDATAITFQNMSIIAHSTRNTSIWDNPLFFVSNGSLLIVDTDLNFEGLIHTVCGYFKEEDNYHIFDVKRNLVLKNVHGVFPGRLSLISQAPASILNLTIEDTVFNLTQTNDDFIFLTADRAHYTFLYFSNITIHIAESCPVLHDPLIDPGLIDLLYVDSVKVKGMRIYFGDNVNLYHFFALRDIDLYQFREIDCHFLGVNITFGNIFQALDYSFDMVGLSEFSDINFRGNNQPFMPVPYSYLSRERAPKQTALIDLLHKTSSALIVQRITGQNLELNETGFILMSLLNIEEIVVDRIGLYNSGTSAPVFDFELVLKKETCSFYLENQALFIRLSRIEIFNSSIVLNSDKSVIKLSTDCETLALKKLFLNTLNLTDWKIERTRVRLPFDADLQKRDFISTSGLNLIFSNFTITANDFYGINIIDLDGPQPIIHLLNLNFTNNLLEVSTFLRKEPDPTTFNCDLYSSYEIYGSEKINNFRYLWIKDSVFSDVSINRTPLFQGDITNIFLYDNIFEKVSLATSSFFNLNYFPCERRWSPPFSILDFIESGVFFSSRQEFLEVFYGQPHIMFSRNQFSAIEVDESVFMNADTLDYFRLMEPFISRIRISENKFTNVSGKSQQRNNLFNFWCGGRITIENNTFLAVMFDGMIFSVLNKVCESRLPSITPAGGTILVRSNHIIGADAPKPDEPRPPFNNTGFFELEALSIQRFDFSSNIISQCNTFNRGFVDISITNFDVEEFTITNNHFMWNKLSIRNSLKANFFNFRYITDSEHSRAISFEKNTFAGNNIEGDAFFTGSLLSLIPSLFQFEGLHCNIILEELNFLGNVYRPHGFLAAITAASVVIKNSNLQSNVFREIKRADSSKIDLPGKQGLFFLGSREIFLINMKFESNQIVKGAFIYLDNSVYGSKKYQPDVEESFKIIVRNCNFERSEVKKGALFLFSGESFPVILTIDNSVVNSKGFFMEYFVKAEDLDDFRLSFTNSNITLWSVHMTETQSSNLFYFNNIRMPKTNESGSAFPAIIDNCTFYFEGKYYTGTPKILITNMNATEKSFAVFFNNSNFLPLYQDSRNWNSGVQFEVANSRLRMQNCTFKGLNFTGGILLNLNGAALADVEDSNFLNCLFNDSQLTHSMSSFLTFSKVVIAGNIFTRSAIEALAYYDIGVLGIIDSNFSGNILYGKAYLVFNLDLPGISENIFTMANTIFENNVFVPEGTCIFNAGKNCHIESSQFISNSLQGDRSLEDSPALENLGVGKAEIENCTFKFNKGTIGGAIRTTENIVITGSSFIENTASVGAGAIFFVPDQFGTPELKDNVMIGNKAPIGNDIVGNPAYFEYEIVEVDEAPGITLLKQENPANISAKNATIIANFTPGAYFNHILKIYAHDEYGNRLSRSLFKSFSDVSFKISRANSTEISDPTRSYYYQSQENWRSDVLRLDGSQFRLIAPFGGYVIMTIIVDFNFKQLNLTLAAQAVQGCLRGSIYDPQSMICEPCKAGWYSVNALDTACLPCPNNGECRLGADKVWISAGYWANMSRKEIKPIKCSNNREACEGGLESECRVGHTGPACEDCAYFGFNNTGRYYSKASAFECKECSSITASVLVMVFAFLGMLVCEAAFILINIVYNEKHIKRILENPESEENPTGAYIRTLVTFMQILGIIQAFSFQLPGFISTLYSIGNPTDTFVYTSQCLIIAIMNKYNLSSVISFPYLMTSIAAGMIVLKLLLCTAIWLGLKLKYKEKIRPKYLIIAFISIFYLEQPSLLDYLYGIISCKEIDGRNVLARFPSFDCATPEQMRFAYRFAIPIIVLVACVLPLAFFLFILRERKQLGSSPLPPNYEALTIEFKSRYFYWVFIILFFKFVLITLSNIFPNSSDTDMKVKALGLLLAFAIYLAQIDYFQPYTSQKLFDMNRYMVFAIIATIFFSYLSLDSSADEVPKWIFGVCFSLVLLINILFLVYSIVMIYQANHKKARNIIAKIGKSFSRNSPNNESEESHFNEEDREHLQRLSKPLLEESNRRRDSKKPREVEVSMNELKPGEGEEV